MKATFISRDKNTVKFTMEFTAEEFEQAQIKVYQEAKNQFEIPGFRKGKAPRSIIEKHYGEGVFFEDEGFTVTITVECFPIVEVKDYKGVEVEKVVQEVKDEDVENELKAVQKRNARMILVERPAKEGDTVLFDYAGFVGDEQFEGGTAERQELVLGSGMFIPGFEEQLTGAQVVYEPAVQDGNVITGRGMGCSAAFALKILEYLTDKRTAEEMAQKIVYQP